MTIFEFLGHVNRHNCRYCSGKNLHWINETHILYPQKVNVWASIIDDIVIEPFFIEEKLIADKYEIIFQNKILPAIKNIIDQNFHII